MQTSIETFSIYLCELGIGEKERELIITKLELLIQDACEQQRSLCALECGIEYAISVAVENAPEPKLK